MAWLFCFLFCTCIEPVIPLYDGAFVKPGIEGEELVVYFGERSQLLESLSSCVEGLMVVYYHRLRVFNHSAEQLEFNPVTSTARKRKNKGLASKIGLTKQQTKISSAYIDSIAWNSLLAMKKFNVRCLNGIFKGREFDTDTVLVRWYIYDLASLIFHIF